MARAFRRYQGCTEELQRHLLALPDHPAPAEFTETARLQAEVESARDAYDAIKRRHRESMLRSGQNLGKTAAGE